MNCKDSAEMANDNDTAFVKLQFDSMVESKTLVIETWTFLFYLSLCPQSAIAVCVIVPAVYNSQLFPACVLSQWLRGRMMGFESRVLHLTVLSTLILGK